MRDAVFLFDVDGTLLEAGSRYHNRSLIAAIERVAGKTPDVAHLALAGRTDTEIVRDMAASVGLDLLDGLLSRVFQIAAAEFEVRCPRDIRSLVIPHVRATLERFQALGAALGLVTGNVEAIAWRKMDSAGLRPFFSFGAFGDESGRRADLPPLAIARGGRSWPPAHSYVIGDTPLDVACGQACGLSTVAVATGRYTLDELRACGPSYACAHLGEFTEAFVAGRV